MGEKREFRLSSLLRRKNAGVSVQPGRLQEVPPAFSMDHHSELVQCPGGELAVCPKFDAVGQSVSFFSEKGEKLRSIPLGYVLFAVVRSGRIYCFSSSGCGIMDLMGNSLPLPWEDYPQAQRYYDMDAEGRRILYFEMRYGSGFFMKDMETGYEFHNFPAPSEHSRMSRLVQCALSTGFFMADGSIVLGREMHFLERFDGKNGQLMQDTVRLAYDQVFADEKRRYIICRSRGQKDTWRVFDAELRPVCEWDNEAAAETAGYVLIPGTSLLAYEAGDRICVRDYINDRIIGSVPFSSDQRDSSGKVRVRPDGKELYVRAGDRWQAADLFIPG